MAAAYPFEGTICYSLTIPELCAEHDQGGGVACGHDFIVFTRYQIPDWYLTKLGSPELLDELTQAALAVEAVVSFYMSRSDLGGQGLRSLPTLQSKTMHEIDKKPWFFLNAAKVNPRGIGIAGRGDTIGGTLVETLLAVLSRPWCILELCYSTTSAVNALLDFANLACQLDVGAYTPAGILLSHELTCRSDLGLDTEKEPPQKGSNMSTLSPAPCPSQSRKHHLSPKPSLIKADTLKFTSSSSTTTTTTTTTTPQLSPLLLPHQTPPSTRTTIQTILTLYTTLFLHPENSYSGFWMRGICTSALRLGTSISVFGSALADSTGAYSDAVSSLNLLHWAVERELGLELEVDEGGWVEGEEDHRRRRHDQHDDDLPSFQEGLRVNVLRGKFERLGGMFKERRGLPGLYGGVLREVIDLTV